MHLCTTEAEYKQMYDAKVDAESSVPPYISLIGSLYAPRYFMVDFENIAYKFFSFSKALDICFKAYYVFNLEHPEACESIWNFMNTQFYKLSSGSDKTKPATYALLNEIKCKLAIPYKNFFVKKIFNRFIIVSSIHSGHHATKSVERIRNATINQRKELKQ